MTGKDVHNYDAHSEHIGIGLHRSPARLQGSTGGAKLPYALSAERSILCEPFFCRQERLLERKTGIAFRIRLGTTAQSDWLERKPGAARPE